MYRLHPPKRPACAMMARLPARLPAALAPTASHALSASESVRRWWFRGDRGVLVAQRQLTLEIGDLFLRVDDFFGRLRQLPLTLGQFATESFILPFQPFLGRCTAPPSRLRHALHGTPIGSICTDP